MVTLEVGKTLQLQRPHRACVACYIHTARGACLQIWCRIFRCVPLPNRTAPKQFVACHWRRPDIKNILARIAVAKPPSGIDDTAITRRAQKPLRWCSLISYTDVLSFRTNILFLNIALVFHHLAALSPPYTYFLAEVPTGMGAITRFQPGTVPRAYNLRLQNKTETPC